ncbi:MAG TPA: hypothetical protein PLS80_12200, partial [Cyclobacteriaceae bacterium]|nr:hypothetical protein [Cyclobacteriaceae bacterium]
LRGPASVLYSTGRPGGVMNMNTKRPLDKERYEVNATYASWNDLSLNFDATGPLSKNKKLCYRIVGGARDAGSFRIFRKQSSIHWRHPFPISSHKKRNWFLNTITFITNKFRGSIMARC